MESAICKPLNVLWIAPYPEKKGAHPAPWIISLAKKLSCIPNLNIEILSPVKGIDQSYSVAIDNYKVHFVKIPSLKRDLMSFYMERILIMKKWIRKNECKFDLIHIHGTEHQYEHAAANSSLPVVISIQGLLFKYVEVLKASLEVRYLTWKVGSMYEKKGIQKHKFFSGRTNWDYNSVKSLNSEIKYFKIWELLRSSFYDHAGKYIAVDMHSSSRILFVGGTNEIKGIYESIDALNRLLGKGLKMQLCIAGNADPSLIMSYISKNQLLHIDVKKDLVFLGLLDEVSLVKEMLQSFCLLHPSWIDNSPNSICESQLIGLPVIAKEVGGVNSLISHEITGLLSNGTSEDLCNQINRLKQDPVLFQAISSNSFNLANKRHDENSIVLDWINTYNQILVKE